MKISRDDLRQDVETYLKKGGKINQGHFCEDPEENIKFIEEMEETTGEFKKKISKYQDAKNKYNELLANQGEV